MTPHQIALLTNARAIDRVFFEYRSIADRVIDGTEFYDSRGGVEGHAASGRWVEQRPKGGAHAVFDSRSRSNGLAGIEPCPRETNDNRYRDVAREMGD